jgi:hypothetical protein
VKKQSSRDTKERKMGKVKGSKQEQNKYCKYSTSFTSNVYSEADGHG